MGPIGFIHFNSPEPHSMTATKADGGKPRMDLIPPEAKMAMAEVFAYGAKKYADRNWEQGLAWGRVAGAMERHFTAWEAGEDDDPESALPHLWHVLTNVAMLVAMEVRGSGTDDRTTFCRAEGTDNNDNHFVSDVSGRITTDETGDDDYALYEPPTMYDDTDDDGDLYEVPPTMTALCPLNQRREFIQGVAATCNSAPPAENMLRLQARNNGF